MKIKKINELGQYTYFPGVTVVAAIKPGDVTFWQEIHKHLSECELSAQYYSLLPFKSYHMTTMNLFTRKEHCEGNWEQFITERQPLFQQIHHELSAISDVVPRITIEHINISGAIQLTLSLPEEQVALIQHVARKFNLEYNTPRIFHMTLAYQYKSLDHATLNMIRTEVNTTLLDVITQRRHLTLTAPRLCYFHDMTAFIPWNAQENPAIAHHARFFEPSKKTATQDSNTLKKDKGCSLQ